MVGGFPFATFNIATMDYGLTYADEAEKKGVDKSQCTSILPKDWCDNKDAPIKIMNLVLYVITAGVGVLGLAGVIFAGVQYATAGDNEAQVTAAKERIRNIVIGLFLWAAMFAMVNWLVIGAT